MSSDEKQDNEINDDDIKDKSVDELIKAITDSKGQYAFLIGAGTSKPAGIPTGSELIEEWQEEAYQFWSPNQDRDEWIEEKEKEIGANQNRYGYWFEQVYTTKEQRRDYIENKVVAGAEPEFGHIVLASMMADSPGEKYVPLAFTPNFDDLLYDAFYHFIGERPLLVNHNALATEFTLTGETPTIVKVHGDYLYQNVKNLSNETRNLEENIEERIVQVIGEFGLVVIGYSGWDESIMEPLIDATRSGEGVFWCTREKDKLSEYAQKLLQQPNTFRVEIEGSEELFSKFFARIDDLQTPRSEDLIERAEQRAVDLSEKRDEAKQHAPEEDQKEFVLSDRFDEANSCRRNGDYKKAKEIFEEIIENEPSGTDISHLYSPVHNNLGHLLYEEFDQIDEARTHFEQAITIDPENAHPHNNIGYLFYKEFDDVESAQEHYKKAIDLSAGNADVHSNLGQLFHEEFDEIEEAREHYELALSIDPEHAGVHNNYGYLFYEGYDDAEAAKKHYEQAIKNDADFPQPYNHLAEILRNELDNPEKAKNYLKQAIEIDPEYADAHYNYAELLEEEFNQPEEAEKHFEQAVELDSNSADSNEDTRENSDSN